MPHSFFRSGTRRREPCGFSSAKAKKVFEKDGVFDDPLFRQFFSDGGDRGSARDMMTSRVSGAIISDVDKIEDAERP